MRFNSNAQYRQYSNLIKQVEIMLNDAVVEFSQYGNLETVSVFTPNKLAQKFNIEVRYATSAHKNGNPPIISARLCSGNHFDINLSQDNARQILRMCYHQYMAQRL